MVCIRQEMNFWLLYMAKLAWGQGRSYAIVWAGLEKETVPSTIGILSMFLASLTGTDGSFSRRSEFWKWWLGFRVRRRFFYSSEMAEGWPIRKLVANINKISGSASGCIKLAVLVSTGAIDIGIIIWFWYRIYFSGQPLSCRCGIIHDKTMLTQVLWIQSTAVILIFWRDPSVSSKENMGFW